MNGTPVVDIFLDWKHIFDHSKKKSICKMSSSDNSFKLTVWFKPTNCYYGRAMINDVACIDPQWKNYPVEIYAFLWNRTSK